MENVTADQRRAIGEICRALSKRLDSGAKPGAIVNALIETFPDPSPQQEKILKEISRAFRKANELERPMPMFERILGVVCSWGDTTEESEVLIQLEEIAAP